MEIEIDPSDEQRLEYTKLLQDFRIRKLRATLTSLRTDLLKRDYDARLQEIAELELSTDHGTWMESYKKLKLKLTGGKAADFESPAKPAVKYYY